MLRSSAATPGARASLQTTRRSSAPVETTPESSAPASGYPGACGTCFRLVHHDRLAAHRGLLTRRPFLGECGWPLVALHYSIFVLPPTLRAVRGATPTCGLRSIAFSLAGFQQPRFGLSTAEAYAVFVQRRERLCVWSHQRDLQPAAMCVPSGSRGIWPQECHTPHAFRPAGYSAGLREPRGITTPRSAGPVRCPCLRDSDCAHYPFRYPMASWLCKAGRHHPFPVRRPLFPSAFAAGR